MNCNCCYTDYIGKCEESLTIHTNLTPSAAYRWSITDKFDHKYEGEVTADENGSLVISVDDLPPGLLTEYSGDFLFQVYDSACRPIKFKVAGEYDCITFHVKGGTFTKDSIGCPVECQGSSESVLIPFTDQTTVNVDYSAYQSTLDNYPVVQVYHELSQGVYQLVGVTIDQIRNNGVLTDINIDNGGQATGYILLS
jgi:hypothetical protein